MNRWKAGVIHLLISVAVVGAIAAFVYFAWTPHGLWTIAGVDRPLLVLFGVVLVVGPTLTALMVYRPGKNAHRSDLVVVAVLQIAFLGYGLWMLARTRPAFLVAAIDRYEVIFANDIDPADLAHASERYRRLSWTGPRIVGLQSGSSQVFGPAIVFDTPQQPAYYTEFEAYAPLLLARAKPLANLMARSSSDHALISATLRRLGRTEESTLFVPVTSRRKGSAVMLIDAASGLPLQTLPLDPWT